MEALRQRQALRGFFAEKLADLCLGIDQADPDRIASAFSVGVVGEYDGARRHTSLAEFLAALETFLGEGSNCGAKQHNILNLQLVEHGQDRARTRCNFYAIHQGKGRFAGQFWETWGEYRDSWRLEAQGWRIVLRQYTTHFTRGPDGINTRD